MTVTPQPAREPTLADVIRRLDEITVALEKRAQWQDKVSQQTEQWHFNTTTNTPPTQSNDPLIRRGRLTQNSEHFRCY